MTEEQANRIIELLEEIASNSGAKLGELTDAINTIGDRISEIAHDVDEFKKKQK